MGTGHLPTRLVAAAAVAIALAPVAVLADDDGSHHGDHHEERTGVDIRLLDSLNTGGAEISAFDRYSRRLFVTDAIGKKVTIVDASNPSNLVPAGGIDVSAAGSPNSVAVGRGMVAVAIQNGADKTKPGVVNFYTTSGAFIAGVRVGALPDMLTFTPDQQHVLVANEGEPNTYAVPGQDPEGSVSIISIQGDHVNHRQGRKPPRFAVRSVDFQAYIGQETALRAQGIRIYGPNANAAQDLEPEYIAVSEDSRTAFVTLQENNAVAKIDIASGKVVSLLPLGYKDYSATPRVNATYVWEAGRPP
jgi:DNA-binding beta-propeller fold protein YncE